MDIYMTGSDGRLLSLDPEGTLLEENSGSDQAVPGDLVIYPPGTGDTPLMDQFDGQEFACPRLAVPARLRRVVPALVRMAPVDRYLAAHYERQLSAVLRTLTPEDLAILESRGLADDWELTGKTGADAFLRFQRKLYLHYPRVE